MGIVLVEVARIEGIPISINPQQIAWVQDSTPGTPFTIIGMSDGKNIFFEGSKDDLTNLINTNNRHSTNQKGNAMISAHDAYMKSTEAKESSREVRIKILKSDIEKMIHEAIEAGNKKIEVGGADGCIPQLEKWLHELGYRTTLHQGRTPTLLIDWTDPVDVELPGDKE